jgi:hypothetical protein
VKKNNQMAFQSFIDLEQPPKVRSSINVEICLGVHVAADAAVEKHKSDPRFERPIGVVLEALETLVGQPQEEERATMLLETARMFVLGVSAGPPARRSVDLRKHCVSITQLQRQAGRAAVTQLRDGCSPAEQGMHLALLWARLQTLPRNETVAAAKIVLTLGISIFKSATTMSLDPRLFSSLKDCVQLAGDATLLTLFKRNIPQNGACSGAAEGQRAL